MRSITAAAVVLAMLAAPALAQQANPGKSSPSQRSSPGTVTGPLGNNPNAQPGNGATTGSQSPNGRATDCPPGNTAPECQQAMVPGSRGENPTRDEGGANMGRPTQGEVPTGPLNGSVDQTQTGSNTGTPGNGAARR